MPKIFGSQKLSQIARQCRLDLLDMLYQSGGGHLGGPLSSMDILVALYFSKIFDFKKDHFILSAGHLAPGLYSVLANANYFDKKNLSKFSSFNSFLQGHISTKTPGVEYSSGSLGQGLSFAAGLALGEPKRSVICLTTDGEQQEGQIWEAAGFAAKYHLGNLINIIDCNGYQIDGSVNNIMPLKNLAAKYVQFGWTVNTVNGHDFNKLISIFKKSKKSNYPNCIIARTIFAKGISFIEKDFHYHDIKNMTPQFYLKAKSKL
jgi:transketolase